MEVDAPLPVVPPLGSVTLPVPEDVPVPVPVVVPVDEPLPDAELQAKFEANLAFGGLTGERIDALRSALGRIADGGAVDLSVARL